MKMRFVAHMLLFSLMVLIDRVTKSLALCFCLERCVINSFLSFDIIFNRGFSWSLFHSDSRYVFMLVTLVTIAVTLFFIWYMIRQFRLGKSVIGELMLVAGSISNIIDRFVFGGVVDFIELSYKDFFWPTFNVADIYIVLGVGIILIHAFRE